MLATCSAQDSGRRVLQIFLSYCGEAPVVGVARTELLENHPASCLPWPCGPAGGMHVYSVTTKQLSLPGPEARCFFPPPPPSQRFSYLSSGSTKNQTNLQRPFEGTVAIWG